MRIGVPVVVLLIAALLAWLVLGAGAVQQQTGRIAGEASTDVPDDADASEEHGSPPPTQRPGPVESDERPRVRAPELATASPAVSLERQAELRQRLGRVANMLSDRWTFMQFGHAEQVWSELPIEERRWLERLFFRVAADSPLLPALVYALHTESPLVDASRERPLDYTFAFDALQGDDPARARRALLLLRAAVFDPGERAAGVEGALIEATRDADTAADALVALGGLRGESAGIEAFLRSEYDARAGALRAAALEGLLRIDDHALWGSSPPDERHGTLLRRALGDPEPQPRIAALEALQDASDPRAFEEEIRACLRSEDTDVRNAGIDTLQCMRPLSLDGARALVMLVENDPATSHNALWALSETGHGDKVSVARLRTSRTPTGHLTCPAIICLRAHGPAAIEALDDLIAVVRGPEVFDASHAVITLRSVAPGDERTFDLLVAQSRRGHYDIEKDACLGLAAFGERGVPHIAPKLMIPMHQADVANALAVACPKPSESPAVWAALDTLKGEERAALAAWLRERVPDDPRLAATPTPR